MESIYYKSIIGKSEICIEFRVNKEKDAYMEQVKYEPEHVKSFFIVLKNAISDLEKKGYKKIVQTVSLQEWIQFLSENKNWTVRNLNNMYEYVNIEVPIENALESIVKGFGFSNQM